MANIKISIITCTLNSGKYLEDCIKSVQNQTYKNFEHIFIDGQSNDKTIDIIKKYYPNPIIYTEKAKGIYCAVNKGLKIAKGEIIGFLHSDDVFYNKECLSRIADSFLSNNEIFFYCSKMIIYDSCLKTAFAILGAPPHKQSFKEQFYSSTYYAHPTYYVKKEVISKVGYYNIDYTIASDIDWLIRLENLDLKWYFDPAPLIKFRSFGRSARKYFLALKEEFNIRRKYEGLSGGLIVIYFYHLLRRIVRYILEVLRLNFLINFIRKFLMNVIQKNVI